MRYIVDLDLVELSAHFDRLVGVAETVRRPLRPPALASGGGSRSCLPSTQASRPGRRPTHQRPCEPSASA